MPKIKRLVEEEVESRKVAAILDHCPFVTGSHAYGEPNEKSDLDLVVLIPPDQYKFLSEHADAWGPSPDRPSGAEDERGPLNFGKLQLICPSNLAEFQVWRDGTRDLIALNVSRGKPVTRDEAIDHFENLRQERGLRD